MNPRQLAAITDPFTLLDPAEMNRHRRVVQAGDGAMLIVVLAVDR